MAIFRRRRRGQAAVEAMYAIPVMLLVYLIGAQLWSITWNAQYAHIKARRDAHDAANHRPCFANGGGGTTALGNIDKTAHATTKKSTYYGERFLPTARDRKMTARARIICVQP